MEVICTAYDCIYNKPDPKDHSDQCSKDVILLDSNRICNDYTKEY